MHKYLGSKYLDTERILGGIISLPAFAGKPSTNTGRKMNGLPFPGCIGCESFCTIKSCSVAGRVLRSDMVSPEEYSRCYLLKILYLTKCILKIGLFEDAWKIFTLH